MTDYGKKKERKKFFEMDTCKHMNLKSILSCLLKLRLNLFVHLCEWGILRFLHVDMEAAYCPPYVKAQGVVCIRYQ